MIHQFVTNQLAKGFDLEKDETYIWQRKDAEPARNETDWDAVPGVFAKLELLMKQTDK